jgi:hypothetical protein
VDAGPAELERRVRRASVGLLTCLAAMGAFFLGPVSMSGARPAGAFSDALTVADTGAVTFSAVVHPHGRATTAFFQFGLATRYREPMPSHPVYDNSTTAVHLAPGFQVYSVSGTASGLVPNALYNLRLVARSSAGTVNSPNATFRTAKDPAPRLPRIGADVNLVPVSGLVLIRPPRANTSRAAAAAAAAARLVAGPSFHPLTEARQLPIGSQVDARAGTFRLVVAGPHGRQTQRVTLTGGVFSLAQSTQGSSRGVTTVNLLQDDFSGAPAYRGCAGHGSAVLQTVHALDQGGRFVTLSRDSSTTARSAGTAWDTSMRCDGTLTAVRRGTVVVFDYPRQQTVVVHAGQRYLANAS